MDTGSKQSGTETDVNREGDRSLCCADRVVNLMKTEPLDVVVELQKDRDAPGFGLQAASRKEGVQGGIRLERLGAKGCR
jgi:hypothetical protein